jgi:hypothetical protein
MDSRILEIIEDRDKKLAEKHKQIDILYDAINDSNRLISLINEEIDDCVVECNNALSEYVAKRAQNDAIGRFIKSLKLAEIVEGDFNYITYFDTITKNDLINLNIGSEVENLYEFLREDYSDGTTDFTSSSDTCSLVITTDRDNIVIDIQLNYF